MGILYGLRGEEERSHESLRRTRPGGNRARRHEFAARRFCLG